MSSSSPAVLGPLTRSGGVVHVRGLSMPPTRTRIPEVRGRLGLYAVRNTDEIDEHLRGLACWLTKQIVASPRFGVTHILRMREDQDLLLDARLVRMRDATA